MASKHHNRKRGSLEIVDFIDEKGSTVGCPTHAKSQYSSYATSQIALPALAALTDCNIFNRSVFKTLTQLMRKRLRFIHSQGKVECWN